MTLTKAACTKRRTPESALNPVPRISIVAALGVLVAATATAQDPASTDDACTRIWVGVDDWSCTAPAPDVAPTLELECGAVDVQTSWHTLAGTGEPVQVVHAHCDDTSTIYALTASGPRPIRTSIAGEDQWRLVSPGTSQSPSPLVMTRVPNALRACANIPPLLTGTWTDERGLSGVVARFQLPASALEATPVASWPDHFSDDTFPVFVSRQEPLGISHSWGNAPAGAWVPGSGSTPPFAVFRAESVPAVAITLRGLSRATDAVLMADDGRRWAISIAAGDATIELPDDARDGCISLQFDDQGGLSIQSLTLNTELDIRALDRAVDVYLLPELGSDSDRRRMAASRILSSGAQGTDELLIAAILDATDAVQADIIDALARRPQGLATLLQAYPELELSPAARDRLGRSLARDPFVAERHLDSLSQLAPELRSEVLRALAWRDTFSPQVASLLCQALGDPESAEDAVISMGGQPSAAIPAIVECVSNAPTTEARMLGLRALLRAVRRHADAMDRERWNSEVEQIAIAAVADTNGSVSRLGIGLCTHLATEACLGILPDLSTTDPDPQLRADAWVAILAAGDHDAVVSGLEDASPTVRLAIAHQLVQRRILLDDIAPVEALMLAESWPSVSRVLAHWLLVTGQSTPPFILETAARLGGSDGAQVARMMDTAGVFPSCASLAPLLPTAALDEADSVEFISAVLGLVASCTPYDEQADPLAAVRPLATSDPRLATALLIAAASQQRPWADDELRRLLGTDPELHVAAVRALPWFQRGTQQSIIDEYASDETDERAMRVFESLEGAR